MEIELVFCLDYHNIILNSYKPHLPHLYVGTKRQPLFNKLFLRMSWHVGSIPIHHKKIDHHIPIKPHQTTLNHIKPPFILVSI